MEKRHLVLGLALFLALGLAPLETEAREPAEGPTADSAAGAEAAPQRSRRKASPPKKKASFEKKAAKQTDDKKPRKADKQPKKAGKKPGDSAGKGKAKPAAEASGAGKSGTGRRKPGNPQPTSPKQPKDPRTGQIFADGFESGDTAARKGDPQNDPQADPRLFKAPDGGAARKPEPNPPDGPGPQQPQAEQIFADGFESGDTAARKGEPPTDPQADPRLFKAPDGGAVRDPKSPERGSQGFKGTDEELQAVTGRKAGATGESWSSALTGLKARDQLTAQRLSDDYGLSRSTAEKVARAEDPSSVESLRQAGLNDAELEEVAAKVGGGGKNKADGPEGR